MKLMNIKNALRMLSEGKKVRCKDWTEREFIVVAGNILVDEESNEVLLTVFGTRHKMPVVCGGVDGEWEEA